MELATVPLSVVHFRGIKRVHTKLEKLSPETIGRGSKGRVNMNVKEKDQEKEKENEKEKDKEKEEGDQTGAYQT